MERYDADKPGHRRLPHVLDTSVYRTYRIAREGGKATHSVWVDGVLVGENLVDLTAYNGASFSFIRFGIPGTTSGGAFDIDYIRWTTDGVFAPYIPPRGTLLTFK